MNLRSYTYLCVLCAFNWFAIAYKTVSMFARKQTKQMLKSTGVLVRSKSFFTTLRKQNSSLHLNMMTVRYYVILSYIYIYYVFPNQ